MQYCTIPLNVVNYESFLSSYTSEIFKIPIVNLKIPKLKITVNLSRDKTLNLKTKTLLVT